MAAFIFGPMFWDICAPTAMDFGFTFVALDPDGHRLRVFAPGAA